MPPRFVHQQTLPPTSRICADTVNAARWAKLQWRSAICLAKRPVASPASRLSRMFQLPLRLRSMLALLLVAAFCFCALALAQMTNPAIDRPNQPFSYFSEPTEELGVMGASSGAEVTPEGYLYTGFGELMFFTGNPPKPIHRRIKTLLDGYLPVIQFEFIRDGIAYRFTMFAATLEGRPGGPLVDFIRVEIANRNALRRTAWFGAAMRYQADLNTTTGTSDSRFPRPVVPSQPGRYSQPGVKFSPDWIYGFADDAFLRDGKLMYCFPTIPAPKKQMTPKLANLFSANLTARRLPILPTTPVGFVLYALPLDPGQSRTLVFKLPVLPLAPDDPAVTLLRAARFDDFLARTTAFWKSILARGIEISVPERKVEDAFRANLFYDLMSLEHSGGDWIQTVNLLQYHAFWLRDASHIVRMYDLSGYHDLARNVLDFFARWQQPDGNFVSQAGQYDGWGQTLYAYGQHYQLTRDRQFAEQVYPGVQHAVAWLARARASDPLGLVPVTTPGDNEMITGHVTGHDFWALDGLQGAIALARGLGRTADAQSFDRQDQSLKAALLRRLDWLTAKTNGYIPAGLDGEGGQDWGNLHSVYPLPILDPFDPRVTATLRVTRAKYAEGIMTYDNGRYLHHYITMVNTNTELIRGDQKTALEEFYAVLVHTSSTHAGFETMVRPWATRDFAHDLAPHGWFAARFRTLLRNMMLREQGDDLHLLSAISPDWVRPGRSIVVRRAPTNFGEVGFELRFLSPTRANLSLQAQFFLPPRRLVLHLPWYMKTISVTADGRSMHIASGVVALPPSTKSVEIQWSRRSGVAPISYALAVQQYQAAERRHWQRFLLTGKP